MSYSWDQAWNTGHELVDAEHQALVVIINDLSEICNNNPNQETISAKLNELAEHTVTHFGDEEKIMLEYSYPQYEVHKKQHDNFVATALQIISEYQTNHSIPDLLQAVDQTIVTWLVKHMKGSDKHFTGYVLAKEA
ncbi:MAG: hemerythrin family protein [Clostridia bacterium]|nr:hemerythrin family protein [Clostridia bacterium]